MKKLQVTIRVFPSAVCSKCGYEYYPTFITSKSHPCHCSECGEQNSMSRYYCGPWAKHVTVRMNKGCYDFLHPHNEEVQYIFNRLPEEFRLSRSFIAHDEICDLEDCSAVEVAELLVMEYKKYLYTSQLANIEVVLAWLQEHEDEQEKMRLEYNQQYAEYNLWMAYLELIRAGGKE